MRTWFASAAPVHDLRLLFGESRSSRGHIGYVPFFLSNVRNNFAVGTVELKNAELHRVERR